MSATIPACRQAIRVAQQRCAAAGAHLLLLHCFAGGKTYSGTTLPHSRTPSNTTHEPAKDATYATHLLLLQRRNVLGHHLAAQAQRLQVFQNVAALVGHQHQVHRLQPDTGRVSNTVSGCCTACGCCCDCSSPAPAPGTSTAARDGGPIGDQYGPSMDGVTAGHSKRRWSSSLCSTPQQPCCLCRRCRHLGLARQLCKCIAGAEQCSNRPRWAGTGTARSQSPRTCVACRCPPARERGIEGAQDSRRMFLQLPPFHSCHPVSLGKAASRPSMRHDRNGTRAA